MSTKIYVGYINRMCNARCQACRLSDGIESSARQVWWSQSDRRCHVSTTCGSPHLSHHHETRNLLCCTHALSVRTWSSARTFGCSISRPTVLKNNPGQGVLIRVDCDLQLYAFCDWTGELSRHTTIGNGLFCDSWEIVGIIENQKASGGLEVFSRGRIPSYGYGN